MKLDQRTFGRAVTASLSGLALQVLMGVILLIYAILGKDHTALTGAWLVLCGIPVWVTLAVVFDQHRRERIEALEAETLDSAFAKQSSVFETGADDLRVNARRLVWMHKYLVPTVSLLLGAGLLVLAYLRFASGNELTGFDKNGVDLFAAVKPAQHGWAITIGIALAFTGFIAARYISGMAKQKVWANLRGGAGYAVVASLVGVLMVAGHAIDGLRRDEVLRFSQVVLPVCIGILGLEVFLTFLLNLYRPRKPGEIPRAAFDSPILSFVASPDRIAKTIGGAISYQFGVDVTGSWAYRLLSRSVLSLVVFGGIVVWLMTCVAVVSPNEQGLRIRYGALIDRVGPGLYFKLPWPLETIDRGDISVNFESNQTMPGMDLATPAPGKDVTIILWTNDHKVEEFPVIVQPTKALTRSGTDDAGHDLSLMIVEVPLVYRVDNLQQWDSFAAPSSRQELLRSLARREILTQLATITEDELLGAGRAAASEELSRRIKAAFARAGTGVEVVFTGIEGVHPPKDAAKKFEEVVSSDQQREELIERGRTNAIESLTDAAGSVDLARSIVAEIDAYDRMNNDKADAKAIAAQAIKIDALIQSAGGRAAQRLAEARGNRWVRHMTERGRAEAYDARLTAYRANPKLYKATLYFGALTEAMRNARVYLVTDNVPDARMTIDLKDLNTGANVFANPSGTNP